MLRACARHLFFYIFFYNFPPVLPPPPPTKLCAPKNAGGDVAASKVVPFYLENPQAGVM